MKSLFGIEYGLSLDAARQLVHAFAPDAHSAEIVRELVGVALAD